MLKYPLELVEGNVDYVVFTAHEYRPNRGSVGSDLGSIRDNGLGTPATTITLYMPNSQPAMNNVNTWGQQTFEGPVGMAKRNVMTAAADIAWEISLGDMGGTAKDVGSDVADALSKFKKIYLDDAAKGATDVAKQMGLDAVGSALGYNANTALALSKGLIYNPNIEMVYNGPGLRSFTFAYTFLPKSEKETKAVHDIIMEFKKWSAPEEKDGMYVIPHIWQVTYFSGGSKNKHLNAFKPAALSGVNVSDNEPLEMHMAYDGGAPITTGLSIQFDEVDVITRDDHKKAGNYRGY
jgi:hypothetical protein